MSLSVEGHVPDGLCSRYIANGPGAFEADDTAATGDEYGVEAFRDRMRTAVGGALDSVRLDPSERGIRYAETRHRRSKRSGYRLSSGDDE